MALYDPGGGSSVQAEVDKDFSYGFISENTPNF